MLCQLFLDLKFVLQRMCVFSNCVYLLPSSASQREIQTKTPKYSLVTDLYVMHSFSYLEQKYEKFILMKISWEFEHL